MNFGLGLFLSGLIVSVLALVIHLGLLLKEALKDSEPGEGIFSVLLGALFNIAAIGRAVFVRHVIVMILILISGTA